MDHIELRVGLYRGGLKELIRKYSEDSGIQNPDALTIIKREGKDVYSTIVSEENGTQDYNLLMTFNGPRKEGVQKMIEEFLADTEIEVVPTPQWLADRVEYVKKAYTMASIVSNSPRN
jgi:hypothetical protein